MYMYVCMRAHERVCTYVCKYVCMHVFKYINTQNNYISPFIFIA